MKKTRDKHAVVLRRYKKVCKEIKLERGHYCTGCGRSANEVPLSFSHLIPRSRRFDLTAEKRNITFHCLSMGERRGCHEIWEGVNRHKLLDYMKNMETILELDPEYYFLISE
tara:strand:+ start:688 stop:1023 length:336 start_codon:yes stop_codon:yes gene_type:complete